jgi:hypothetical protein
MSMFTGEGLIFVLVFVGLAILIPFACEPSASIMYESGRDSDCVRWEPDPDGRSICRSDWTGYNQECWPARKCLEWNR